MVRIMMRKKLITGILFAGLILVLSVFAGSSRFTVYAQDQQGIDYSLIPSIYILNKEGYENETSYSLPMIYFDFDKYNYELEENCYYSTPKNNLSMIQVVSSDASIADITSVEYSQGEYVLYYSMKKAGTVTFTFTDVTYGTKIESITLKITDEKVRKAWESTLRALELYYGCTTCKATASEGDTVKLIYAGKEWKKTVPASGEVLFTKLPVTKHGTKATFVFYKADGSLTATKKITINTHTGISVRGARRSSRKLRIIVYSAKKGDVVKIKIGKKTYTKKIKKNYYMFNEDDEQFEFTQKIRKLKRGTKIRIVVYNKFKEIRKKKTIKIK